jgi:enamine deaminase RidA (YjgF/YER057c/UK114 family)
MSPVAYNNPSTIATPLGSYSHVSRAGDLVVVAGQVGVDPSGEIATDFAEQVRRTFANLAAALDSEGLGLANVLKFTTYLVSTDDIPRFYEARNVFFPELFPSGKYPPNTLLVVDRLVYPELRLEIEAIAHA